MLSNSDKKIIFELRVVDIFNFEDGRTLFSGELIYSVHSINKCLADILVNGHHIKSIEIESGWMPSPKQINNPLLMTVSTLQKIDKSSLPFKNKKVVLLGYKF